MKKRALDNSSFPRNNSRKELERLLGTIIDHPERRAEITEIIERTFSEQRPS
jgi:hypothetical protein